MSLIIAANEYTYILGRALGMSVYLVFFSLLNMLISCLFSWSPDAILLCLKWLSNHMIVQWPLIDWYCCLTQCKFRHLKSFSLCPISLFINRPPFDILQIQNMDWKFSTQQITFDSFRVVSTILYRILTLFKALCSSVLFLIAPANFSVKHFIKGQLNPKMDVKAS